MAIAQVGLIGILTIKMHDGLLTPRSLMRVEMRYAKKLPPFFRLIRGSEDQTVQILCRVDQTIEGTLILRFGERCPIEVNVRSKECRPCWLVHRLYRRDLKSSSGGFC
jgi:hypothetical protein